MSKIDGAEWKRINGTAAGTTVVLNRPGNLRNIYVGQTRTGTVSLYDSPTAAGTAAGNYLGDTVNTTIANHAVNLKVKNGLVAISGGTTDLLLGVD